MGWYVLTLDKGTSVIKSVLFDDQGREVATARGDGPTRQPQSGWHEEDSETVWSLVAQLFREVRASSGVRPDEVAVIAVTSHMGGLLLLDGAHRPVYPNVLWDDTRANDIVAEWAESGVLAEIVTEGGQAVLAGLTVPLLRWFDRYEPALLEHTKALCTTKDYLVLRLTGSLGTDESDAGWMPSDPFRRAYSERIWSLAGISHRADLFPPIRRSEAVAGTLLPSVASELGLKAGTPVIAGIGDANASTIGVGAIEPRQGVSIIGTSLLNNVVTGRPTREPLGIGFVIPTANGRWLRMLPNTGGGSINVQWLVDVAYRDSAAPFQKLDEEAAGVAPGASGVFYHPYISRAGVVAPFYHLGARAQFTGLHTSIGRPELARAVLEGLAYSIRDCFEPVPVQLSDVRLSGGSARSPVLCQVVADVLGKPVVLTTGEESAARGAAIVAAWGTGRYQSLKEATSVFVSVRRIFTPNPAAHAEYAERFDFFKRIRDEMLPLWSERKKFELDVDAMGSDRPPGDAADGECSPDG